MIPVSIMVEAGSKKLKRRDLEWQRLLGSTGQMNFLSPENFEKVLKLEQEMLVERIQKFITIKHQSYGGDREQTMAGVTGEDES